MGRYLRGLVVVACRRLSAASIGMGSHIRYGRSFRSHGSEAVFQAFREAIAHCFLRRRDTAWSANFRPNLRLNDGLQRLASFKFEEAHSAQHRTEIRPNR